MKRNTISLSDFKLRFFIDTNVFIDYIENFNEKKCVRFINYFRKPEAWKKGKGRKKIRIRRKTGIDDIELVTSDYVLWEFKGHMREELYARKLVNEHGYGLIAANKESKNGNFKKYANIKCMKLFGEEIGKQEKRIFDDEKLIYLDRLVGKQLPGFSEIIDAILKSSKFTYKDAIVFASALFTRADFIITCDEQHFTKDRFEELRGAMKDWQQLAGIKRKIEFKKPGVYSNIKVLRADYQKWFTEGNEKKIIGDIKKHYPRINVVEINCRGKNFIQEGDVIWLVRFINGKMQRISCHIKNGNLRNPKTKNNINKGKHVTIKLPYQKKHWDNGFIFLAE